MPDATSLAVIGAALANPEAAKEVSKGVKKVLYAVANQIGLVLEPEHIRRKAKAESEAKVTAAKADGDAQVIAAEADAQAALIKTKNEIQVSELKERAQERARKKEEKRQANLEAIAARAADHVPDNVEDEPVDQDWLSAFLESCQDISSEQMQTVWGKLLAGEVAKPGSYALKTLNAVKVLSKSDADLFTKLCSTVWSMNDITQLVYDHEDPEHKKHINIGLTELARLEEVGLLKLSIIGSLTLNSSNNGAISLNYFDRQFIVTPGKIPKIKLGSISLTQAGRELISVAGGRENIDHFNVIMSALKKDGWQVQEFEKVKLVK